MNRRVVAQFLLAAVALIVLACGDGGDEDVLGLGDRELDRCSLVSADEVEQWLGSPVTAAQSEGFDGKPDPVTCLYEGSSATVLVQVYDGVVFYAEEGSSSRVGETLEGLGEDAWSQPGDVNFLQNDWTVSVARIIGQVTDGDLLDMAGTISSRLP